MPGSKEFAELSLLYSSRLRGDVEALHSARTYLSRNHASEDLLGWISKRHESRFPCGRRLIE